MVKTRRFPLGCRQTLGGICLASAALIPTGNLAQGTTGVVGWGAAGLGEIGIPPGLTNVVFIAARSSWTGLKSDGTIVGVSGLSNVVAIAVGYSHGLAVTNGNVYASGDNSAGELNVPPGLSNVVAVAAGVEDSLALKSDGTVTGWGYNGYGQVSIPSGLSNVVAIAAGYYHCLALKSDGTVMAWGYDGDGETNVPAGLNGVVALSGGYYHSLALKTDGTVVAWGGDGSGQTQVPAGLSNVVAIAAGANDSMALKNDGTVVVWGDNFYDQTNVPVGLSNVVGIAGADTYSLALTNDGSPWIVTQPASRLAYEGSTVTFSAIALGEQPMSCRWQLNGEDISGDTNVTLTLTNVQVTVGDSYDVVISNDMGEVISSNATLSVIPPPPITVQPQNLTTNGGANVTFSASITGQGVFDYQWQFDGTNIIGATNITLTLTNALDSQSGVYNLVASNAAGTIVSPGAMLTVVPWVEPSISPTTVISGAGTVVVFSLSTGGFSPGAVYQWQFNNTNLGGFWAFTSSTEVAEWGNPPMSAAGAYDIIASDACATAISSNATLSIIPLVVTNQPQSRGAWIGGAANLGVTAIGATPIGYQWQFNGTNIPGANTNPLMLTNVQATQFGAYDVIVTNAYTNITSGIATLSISQVAVWGNGANGETNLPPGLTNIIAVSGGAPGAYDCQALRSDGTILTWPNSWSSFATRGASNLIAIAGVDPSFGLRPNGIVVQWPSDGAGITGFSNTVAISLFSGSYVLTLKSNGTVVQGSGGPPPPAGLTNVVAIAGGNGDSLALKVDGTLTGWGANTYGQVTPPSGLSNIVAVAAGGYHSLALKSDGTVVSWGSNAFGQTNVPSGLSNVVAIAAGLYHSLALKSDGTVVAWGLNGNGQTNVPPGLTNVIAIAAGLYDSLALIGNGPPQTQAMLTGSTIVTNRFGLFLPTQSGRVYMLQYKNSLSDSNWTALPLAAGNGGALTLTDPAATNTQRFYRVLRW